MTGTIENWTFFLRRYLWPHLIMGMMTVFFGLPVNGPAGVNVSVQPVNRGYPDENTRIQQLLSLSKQATGRSVTSGVSYWHQHRIRIVIRRLAFMDLMRGVSLQPKGTRQSIQTLGELHSKLIITQASPRLFCSALVSSALSCPCKQIPILTTTMKWLAVVKGIRAGPTSV